MAPTFNLPDQNGKFWQLADFSGTWLVLYFYPKDDTPACTKEACNFRDGRELLRHLGAEVVGISRDSMRRHANFVRKYNLNFTLLSDPDHQTIEAYGSWRLKKFMGREFLGTTRDTYLITPQGQLYKKYEGVNPATHVADIVADLKAASS